MTVLFSDVFRLPYRKCTIVYTTHRDCCWSWCMPVRLAGLRHTPEAFCSHYIMRSDVFETNRFLLYSISVTRCFAECHWTQVVRDLEPWQACWQADSMSQIKLDSVKIETLFNWNWFVRREHSTGAFYCCRFLTGGNVYQHIRLYGSLWRSFVRNIHWYFCYVFTARCCHRVTIFWNVFCVKESEWWRSHRVAGIQRNVTRIRGITASGEDWLEATRTASRLLAAETACPDDVISIAMHYAATRGFVFKFAYTHHCDIVNCYCVVNLWIFSIAIWKQASTVAKPHWKQKKTCDH